MTEESNSWIAFEDFGQPIEHIFLFFSLNKADHC